MGADGRIWPYVCPAGYWTQGWGRLVREGALPQDHSVVDIWFDQDVFKHRIFALELSPILEREREGRQSAITSFIYNLGPGRYKGSTLRRCVNGADWDRAAIEIRKWVFGGGKALPGLVLRRAAEAALLV